MEQQQQLRMCDVILMTYFSLSLFSHTECHRILNGDSNTKKYAARKLCGTFEDKLKYIVHYRHLKTLLKLGLKLKKIHRVVSFKQAPYLRTYIELCTRLRREATSAFGKRLWKLS